MITREEVLKRLLETHDKLEDGRLHTRGFGTVCDGILHDYKKLLQNQPQRTKQEYIDEIIDGLNEYMFDGYIKVKNGYHWFYDGVSFQLRKDTGEFVYAIDDNNLSYFVHLPLPLAKLIIDFFTEYGDKE